MEIIATKFEVRPSNCSDTVGCILFYFINHNQNYEKKVILTKHLTYIHGVEDVYTVKKDKEVKTTNVFMF